MKCASDTWVIVLAAGEGSRLHCLTRTSGGVAVPKQFCSLSGGLSLLQETLRRAAAIAQPDHVCAIVAEQHRHWWCDPLRSLDANNIIVQPSNRGTANGVLLPLLHILRRDPDARIVLLPSDHYVDDEAVLTAAMHDALDALDTRPRDIVMLGIKPDRFDGELGYIVPGIPDASGSCAVARFVEKPPAALAQSLMDSCALWNTFIVVACAQALLQLYVERFPQIVAEMKAVVAADADRPDEPVEAHRLYRDLADIDFSRHIVEGVEARLRVLPVAACGWSDLGTPKRLAETLNRLPPRSTEHAQRVGVLSLAARFAASDAIHAAA